jgi:hypothetical protein
MFQTPRSSSCSPLQAHIEFVTRVNMNNTEDVQIVFVQSYYAMKKLIVVTLLGVSLTANCLGAVNGWLNWRGPEQSGVSRETGLPERVDPENPLWRVEFPGASTPVIANGKLYIIGLSRRRRGFAGRRGLF